MSKKFFHIKYLHKLYYKINKTQFKTYTKNYKYFTYITIYYNNPYNYN